VILILGMLPARIIPVGAHGSLTAGVAALARRCTLGVLPGAVFGGRQAGRPLDGAAFLLRRSAPPASSVHGDPGRPAWGTAGGNTGTGALVGQRAQLDE
jgi:hypothetical protein